MEIEKGTTSKVVWYAFSEWMNQLKINDAWLYIVYGLFSTWILPCSETAAVAREWNRINGSANKVYWYQTETGCVYTNWLFSMICITILSRRNKCCCERPNKCSYEYVCNRNNQNKVNTNLFTFQLTSSPLHYPHQSSKRSQWLSSVSSEHLLCWI